MSDRSSDSNFSSDAASYTSDSEDSVASSSSADDRADADADSEICMCGPFLIFESHDCIRPTPLVLTATRKNDLGTVKRYIDTGLDLNERINGTTCLHEAVKKGHAKMIELLLDSGANLGCVDSRGQGLLHVAVQIEDRDTRWKIVRLLMNGGSSVIEEHHLYRGSTYNTTCVHEAVKINDCSLVQFFLDAGAEINCFDSQWDGLIKETPLQLALALSQDAHFEMAKKLIAAGSDVNLGQNDYSSLHTAVVQETCNWELIQLLLNAGAQLNQLCRSTLSPLALAAKLNRCDLVEKMIEAGADTNISKCCSDSALELAITQHHPNVVDLLLRKGADVNARDKDGKSILYSAVYVFQCCSSFEKTDILKILMTSGAIMDGPELGKYKPFEVLLENGNMDAINIFIQNGMKLEDCGVQYPLHCAAINRKKEVLQFLLEGHIYDIDEVDDRGSTALLIAVYYRRIHNVKLLIEWGANGNIPCVKKGDSRTLTAIGRTALGEAFASGQPEFSELLLAAGANMNLKIPNLDIRSIVTDACDEMDCIDSYIEYLVLRKSQGFHVNPLNERYLMEKVPKDVEYVGDKCRNELEILRTTTVYGDTSLYDLLSGKNITRYINNPRVAEMFESLEVEKRFPRYGKQIRIRYSLNLLKRKLMDVAFKGLYKIFGSQFCGNEILLKILMQLHIRDLHNLCVI